MANPELQRRASLYAKAAGIAIDPRPFDGGEDGSVWHTNNHSVVKSFERHNNYLHELECYKRLQAAEVGKKVKIRDFNVPELIGHNDQLWVIEMGVVFPPYILDFGKAYLSDPRWPAHILADWNDKMAWWWEGDVIRVKQALFALRAFGIWYYDAKPGNVMLENWNPILGDD
jgi:hypothetical protein